MLWCFTVGRSGQTSNAGSRLLFWAVLVLAACAENDGTTSTPVAAGAGGTTSSDAEWQTLTGPQPGVHEVYDAACGGQLISQDYRVVPTVGCAERRDERGIGTLTRDCTVADYCTAAADCTAQARGVCTGHAYASCEYAGLEPGAPCERDADCSALPGGVCTPRIEGGGQLCYPTGECHTTPLQGCTYAALGQLCTLDTDCTAAPGGSCRRTISFTECSYHECDAASDCGPAARCECFGVRQCIPAECFADTDCGAGYRCEPTLALVCGSLSPPVGYHCHAVNDECQSDAECGGLSCVFEPEQARWACRDTFCFTR